MNGKANVKMPYPKSKENNVTKNINNEFTFRPTLIAKFRNR